MFAAQASRTMFQVESRLALTVASSTVRQALKAMSEAQRRDFKLSEKMFWVVSDNVQGFSKKRDHRMGRPSEMIKGMAATTIEMEGVDPEAFNLKTLLNYQAMNERKELTTDVIFDDINWTHLDNVVGFQFLQVLCQ